MLKQEFDQNWLGTSTFHFEDLDVEFNILAKSVSISGDKKIIYAIDNSGIIELERAEFVILMSTIFGSGAILFIIASTYIRRSANQISQPISELSKQLFQPDNKKFTPLQLSESLSDELKQMLIAINRYRHKISEAFEREQYFTRYVSHELRTPMTVIKGSLSIIRRSENAKVLKHSQLIEESLAEMEQLTDTFLQLAREELPQNWLTVDEKYLAQFSKRFKQLLINNNVRYQHELLADFNIKAHPQLFSAVIDNLLKNAINCSLDGTVTLFISEDELSVVDNGIGLDATPRGYEGFGVGLKIVDDICQKYHWRFELKSNAAQGCTARVIFNDLS